MKSPWKKFAVCALMVGSTVGAALACGHPPVPPPPPPKPPLVCCMVIDHFVDPTDPNFECVIVRYFRRDGLPLYSSNPMPLVPGQFCLCALPPLGSAAIACGARIVATTFGDPKNIPWQGLPPDQPPYGPFQPVNDPNLQIQVDQFFTLYAEAATPPPTAPGEPQNIRPPDTGLSQLWTFGPPAGATGQIPPNVVFDIYQKIRVPRGFDPNCLCPPNQIWFFGLFFVDQDAAGNTILQVEPGAAGNGLTFGQFAQNPQNSAFYKFRWYRPVVPPPCPPTPGPCPGDANGDGVVNFADITGVVANWLRPCP